MVDRLAATSDQYDSVTRAEPMLLKTLISGVGCFGEKAYLCTGGPKYGGPLALSNLRPETKGRLSCSLIGADFKKRLS